MGKFCGQTEKEGLLELLLVKGLHNLLENNKINQTKKFPINYAN